MAVMIIWEGGHKLKACVFVFYCVFVNGGYTVLNCLAASLCKQGIVQLKQSVNSFGSNSDLGRPFDY